MQALNPLQVYNAWGNVVCVCVSRRGWRGWRVGDAGVLGAVIYLTWCSLFFFFTGVLRAGLCAPLFALRCALLRGLRSCGCGGRGVERESERESERERARARERERERELGSHGIP